MRTRAPGVGLWDVPGGFCEGSEHPARTAEREALEETGLTVVAGCLIGIWMDRYVEETGDEPQWTMNLYYECTNVSGSVPTISDEVDACGWFTTSEPPGRQLLAFPDQTLPLFAELRRRAAGTRQSCRLGDS